MKVFPPLMVIVLAAASAGDQGWCLYPVGLPRKEERGLPMAGASVVCRSEKGNY